jgi:TatD DNase family protein
LDLYKDRNAVREDIERFKIGTFGVTTTPRAFEPNQRLFGDSALVTIGLGIHPELATTREADLALFTTHLKEARVIGEIGLDGRPQNRDSLPAQRDLLRNILQLSVSGPTRVFSFHSTRAVSEVLDAIERHVGVSRHVTILHWFTGTKKELQRGADLGCYFSVNRAMCKKSGSGELLKLIPDELLITETDGPFVKDADRVLFPSDVLTLERLLAATINADATDTRNRVVRNAMRVLERIGLQ